MMHEPAPLPLSPRGTLRAVPPNSRPMRLRCPRKSVVVFAGSATASDQCARALEQSLVELGVETKYIGREDNAHRIATLIAEEGADAVELCLTGGAGGVILLRHLLRALIEIGRPSVSIVVHRVKGEATTHDL